jgi:predicted NACHT family NTPase
MTVKARRSLKASAAGIRRANRAVLVFATKIDLAAELEISRATVQNFFAAKPIGRENFHKICQALSLPWQEIADLSEDSTFDFEPAPYNPGNAFSDVLVVTSESQECTCPDARLARLTRSEGIVKTSLNSSRVELISTLRQQIAINIEYQCSSLRVLDMCGPRLLKQIYTEVKLLEKINSRQRMTREELLITSKKKSDDRPQLNATSQIPQPGLQLVEQYSKLIILGRPGAGKTSFLKYIALECIAGNFLSDRVPIFISLKNYGEFAPSYSLLSYITEQFATFDAIDPQLIADAITRGQALLLLDGLDEVRSDDRPLVFQALRQFIAQFHANRFVITCRLAAQDYVFEQFTEVEIADFDSAQIISFAAKWFSTQDAILQLRFIHALHENPAILELAASPLLLTLLCLVFEDSAAFPKNRTLLYKEALRILFRTWDVSRDIERDSSSATLSLADKEDLLSQIALLTFERREYFLLQKELEHWMSQWIAKRQQRFPSTHLELSAEGILKSMESHHGLLVERAKGVYSFPYFIFHEYFAARGIVAEARSSSLETVLHRLLDQIIDPDWYEVFLLTVDLLDERNSLPQLLAQIMDRIVQTANVPDFAQWLTQKIKAVSPSSRRDESMIRALYVDLELSQTLNLPSNLQTPTVDNNQDSCFTAYLERDATLKLDWMLVDLLQLTRTLPQVTCENALKALAMMVQAEFLVRKLTTTIGEAVKSTPILAMELQHLQQQLPNLRDCSEINSDKIHSPKLSFQNWWTENGETWTQQLSSTVKHHRGLGNSWQLNTDQTVLLKKYCQVNQLLINCLRTFTVSRNQPQPNPKVDTPLALAE